MSNSNCLQGLACPSCGNDSMLTIEARVLAVVTDDGAETFGDMEWNARSYAECPECGHQETLAAFQAPATHPSTTREE